jgi:hypothetical protein
MDTKKVALYLSYEEMDRLLCLLTATGTVGLTNGYSKLNEASEKMVTLLADSDPKVRTEMFEMQKAVAEGVGRPYYFHALEQVRSLLEKDDENDV